MKKKVNGLEHLFWQIEKKMKAMTSNTVNSEFSK